MVVKERRVGTRGRRRKMLSDLGQGVHADEMQTRTDVSCVHANQIGVVTCLLYHKALSAQPLILVLMKSYISYSYQTPILF